jgi:hypothetical protein
MWCVWNVSGTHRVSDSTPNGNAFCSPNSTAEWVSHAPAIGQSHGITDNVTNNVAFRVAFRVSQYIPHAPTFDEPNIGTYTIADSVANVGAVRNTNGEPDHVTHSITDHSTKCCSNRVANNPCMFRAARFGWLYHPIHHSIEGHARRIVQRSRFNNGVSVRRTLCKPCAVGICCRLQWSVGRVLL